MLLNFSIENYKNFKEKQTLKLDVKGKNYKKNIFTKENNNFLTSIAIYGENGSGKSNLLKAMFFVRDFIIRPLIASTPTSPVANDIFLKSFKLDNDCMNKPSRFEIEFIVDGEQWFYAFECDNERVHFEQLELKNKKTKKYNYLYKRKNDEIFFNENSDSLLSNKITEINRKEYEEIKRKTKSEELEKYRNVLYLSLLCFKRVDFAYNIFMFFATKFFVFPTLFNDGKTDGGLTVRKLLENKDDDRERIINFLNSANINIEDIKINRKEADSKNINLISNQIVDSKSFVNEIKFSRLNKQGEKIDFDFLIEESDGTKKLFNLIGDLINVLENGLIVAFDELDKSLHLELFSFIINLFNDRKINKKGAQLIFTTHNTSLLGNRFTFLNEQIYIIDKKYSGESELYSLKEFGGIQRKVSKENLYLNKQLGGTPNITDFML